MIFKLAFLNLFRHRARFFLSLMTISGAIASTIVFRGYSHNILDQLRLYGAENQFGHIQIGAAKLWSPTSERIKDQLHQLAPSVQLKVKEIPGLASASPRLSLQGLISRGDNQFGGRIIGYDPVTETTFASSLRMVEGTHLRDPADLGILLGSGLRDRLKASVGDTVSVVTQTVDGVVNASDLVVRGIFQTTVADIDNQVAFAPLVIAQTLLDTSHVEVWTIRLRDINATNKVRDQLVIDMKALQPELVVKSWRDLADLYNRTEEFFGIQNMIVQLILSVLTVLAILNTVGMSVYERTGEIGTLRSLGHRRAEIVFQFLLEGFYLSIFGGVFGSIFGIIAVMAINASGLSTALPGASVNVPIRADLVVSAFALAVGMGIAATLLGTVVPAWRASRLSVVDALRRNI